MSFASILGVTIGAIAAPALLLYYTQAPQPTPQPTPKPTKPYWMSNFSIQGNLEIHQADLRFRGCLSADPNSPTRQAFCDCITTKEITNLHSLHLTWNQYYNGNYNIDATPTDIQACSIYALNPQP